ncbi:TPA: DUF1329 domain-containing protein [Pseudomonas aeruginosa]|nr:DUF1329 domain-containing protein [Pseudomonas aeruginosa]
MIMNFRLINFSAAAAILLSLSPMYVQAKVSAEEAARLGKDLTPTGAIKAGDEALGIPEWTGGLSVPPSSYKAGGFEVDPFPDQKPIFTIDASNYKQYEDKLSEGVKALFVAYPETFKLPIYKTERTFAAPKSVYENTAKNAVNAELVKGGNGFTNAYGGVPFPIPKSGVEVVWNHITRWRGLNLKDTTTAATVYSNGEYSLLRETNESFFNYYAPGKNADSLDNIMFKYLFQVVPPSRYAGEITLIHETINQVKEPRLAWVYMSGQRRVRRAPTAGYDSPDDGRVYDENDMYNGAPDRFTWSIVGKKAFYIPYNNHRLGEHGVKHEDIIHKSHINPDLTRWELHRVWVIEGDLKDGERHVYKKRRFYVDEDSWAVMLSESYDNRGGLWRASIAYPKQAYQVPATVYENIAYMDLLGRSYSVAGIRTQEKTPRNYDVPTPPDDYWSPANLRRMGTK